MNKIRKLLSHLTLILALMFLTFLVLDQFNPLMNFVDNDISRVLLALLCLSGALQSILGWIADTKA
ncbi:MAG: hypothetical protein IKQ41_12285 [Clostridia bacterium]|nr:hypothetical protein [Clostridia bacterium]